MASARQRTIVVMVSCMTIAAATAHAQERASLVAPGAKLVTVGDEYQFTEGPTADAHGNVYFSDIRASRTYKWSPDGKITLFREDTGSANGLAFDKAGNLIACEGGRGRITSVDKEGKVVVVADKYDGKPFNQPNDLWIDPKGGVYFSDPIYGRAEKSSVGCVKRTDMAPGRRKRITVRFTHPTRLTEH